MRSENVNAKEYKERGDEKEEKEEEIEHRCVINDNNKNRRLGRASVSLKPLVEQVPAELCKGRATRGLNATRPLCEVFPQHLAVYVGKLRFSFKIVL